MTPYFKWIFAKKFSKKSYNTVLAAQRWISSICICRLREWCTMDLWNLPFGESQLQPLTGVKKVIPWKSCRSIRSRVEQYQLTPCGNRLYHNSLHCRICEYCYKCILQHHPTLGLFLTSSFVGLVWASQCNSAETSSVVHCNRVGVFASRCWVVVISCHPPLSSISLCLL